MMLRLGKGVAGSRGGVLCRQDAMPGNGIP